ncbi:MAG TPA: hypothetical protein VME63_15955 [Dyella sp.]|uniref:hypothetical protein n=1 Tax=Dyella sp. TaxID=1869338 RepID=UPI002C227BCE|nr:hypothetical protein [Dyella sp.]HTV86895.1 hypothetical protein [Dyella sp.]
MSARKLAVLGCTLWMASTATPAHAQSASEWMAEQAKAAQKSDQIMAQASAHKGLLAQYLVLRKAYASDNSRAFHMIFSQYLSWYQSYLGAYPLAAQTFSIACPSQPDDRPSPLAGGHYTARPAVEAIAELAQHYNIVLFNEAHHIALTRSLTVQLLSRLRAEGFDYFAAETLAPSDTALATRGYPNHDSGFYTEEPVYAEMVRTALKLGFKVIAYEATSGAASGDAREAEQAQNLYRQVFAHDPKARLIVNAGYEHIVKSGLYLGGRSMAEHLFALTGQPMLSVEQTMLYPRPSSSGDHPYYTEVMGKLHPDQPIVFVDDKGKPWSLRPGYDVSVFFPPVILRHGRPTWLDLGRLRRPYPVSADDCRHHYPCLVQARYDNEGPDAIPADRLLLDQAPLGIADASQVAVYSSTQEVPSGDLYLRPGKYELSFIVDNDRVIHREQILVPDAPR